VLYEYNIIMPGLRSVAESAVAQVLHIDTCTHAGFGPAVSERSLSAGISRVLKQQSIALVRMDSFEFDMNR
jgi:hypothetical protein